MTTGFTSRHPRPARALAAGSVALAALLVAVWVAPRASGTAAAWMRAPSVRLHTLRAPGDGRLAVARAVRLAAPRPPSPSTPACASRWPASPATYLAGAAHLRLRTSLDGAAWGRWLAAPLEIAERPAPPRHTSTRSGPATPATFRSRPPPARSRARRPSPASASSPSTPRRRQRRGARHRRLASTGGHRRRRQLRAAGLAASSAPDDRHPLGVGRGREACARPLPPTPPSRWRSSTTPRAATLYSQRRRTGTGARHLRLPHQEPRTGTTSRYNFLVDRFGTIYEGRYGGVSRGVVGAHVYGFNTGSTGISVMGTFIDEAPPAEAVAALERLLAWKLAVHGLDPSGTARAHLRRHGEVRQGRDGEVPGHRGPPPGQLHRVPRSMPSMRCSPPCAPTSPDVWAPPSSPPSSASTPLISPNGDGVLDTTDLNVAVGAPADWRLALQDAGGQTDRRLERPGRRRHRSPGTAPRAAPRARRRLHRRTYRHGRDGDAASRPPPSPSTRRRPALASAAARPLTFSPNGDGRAETTTVAYAPAEACSVRVGILDASGDVVRWLHGWHARKARQYCASPGTGASPPAAASSPPPTASTASTSSAATPAATSPGRASRSRSTARSASRRPHR